MDEQPRTPIEEARAWARTAEAENNDRDGSLTSAALMFCAAQAWASIARAESLHALVTRPDPPMRCLERLTIGEWPNRRGLVCSLIAGHSGPHIDASGTTFEPVL